MLPQSTFYVSNRNHDALSVRDNYDFIVYHRKIIKSYTDSVIQQINKQYRKLQPYSPYPETNTPFSDFTTKVKSYIMRQIVRLTITIDH